MTVRARLKSVAEVIAGALPDIRDLHVYGGGLLMALGVSAWSRPAALIVFGLVLFYLGLRRQHGMAP